MREYMRKRRLDPVFKEKQYEYQRRYNERKYGGVEVKVEEVKPVDMKMEFIKLLLTFDLSADVKAQVLYQISKTD